MNNAPPPARAPLNDAAGAPDLDPCLDAGLVAQLDALAEPPPLPAGMAQRVKQRLLQRIAADATPRHLTLADPEAGWLPFGPGLAIKPLHEDGELMSYYLRLAPGASLPAHRHPHDEECVVLQGRVQIGELDLGPGGYHLGRRHLPHDRLCSAGGALVFLRGAAPSPAQII